MSIGGRNHHRGSTVHVYRALKGEAAGGLTSRAWVRTHDSLRVAIYTTTDAIARQVFGQEAEVDASVVVPAALSLQQEDALVVVSGEHQYRRFLVMAARPLRRFTECGLVVTHELIDDTLPVADQEQLPAVSR